MDKALGVLSSPNALALSREVDARVRAGLDGLVAGDSMLPEGWTRALPQAAQARMRRVNRRRAG